MPITRPHEKRRPLPLLLLSVLLLVSPLGVAGKRLLVFTGILPIQTFVERVGGDLVEVRHLVEPGHSPATFSPTPRQVAALARADLYVAVGVPFERNWLARIRAANPRMPVLDLSQGMTLRKLPGDSQQASELDPHIWTSPPRVERMVERIGAQLGELDPPHRADYRTNARAYIERLERLHQEIRQLLAPLKQRRFLVFHPAWGYFAETYGLTQIAIEHQGKQPGARALAEIVRQARAAGTRVIFVQPEFDRRLARRVAEAIGGRLLVIDPLAADYIANMRQVARRFREALGSD